MTKCSFTTKHGFAVSRAALAFAFALAPGLARADEAANEDGEIIVTATRATTGAQRDTLGGSVTTLEAADLEVRQTRIVSDVLRDVPGAAVSRVGGVGGLTQVRLRGAEANHTLVLVDGMEVSDPFQGEFDFSTLIADDVARIEVLRGQQGALYGSDAIGGVIHYMTASGAEAPGVRGRIEYGSFNSFDTAVRVADVAGPVDFAVSAGHQTTDGTPNSRFGARDLAARNSVLSGRFVLSASENLRLRLVGRASQTEADTNAQDFSFPPGPTFGYAIDSDGRSEAFAAYGLASLEIDLANGAWSHALTWQGVTAGRDEFAGDARASGDDGGRLKASYVTSLRGDALGAAHTLTGVADFERESFRNTGPGLTSEQATRREIETVGLALHYDVRNGSRWGVGLAVRHDDNDLFDDATTWRAQGSVAAPLGARLHASAGSGIKNPGMFELFGFDPATFTGNPSLKPERSQGWEAGVELTGLDGRARIDATYFDNTLDDEIFTVFGGPPFFFSSPANRVTQSTQRGVEIAAQARIGEAWRVAAAYAFLDAEENGLEEVRRPPHLASLNVAWRGASDAFGAFLTVRYNGQTYDNNFTLTGGPRVRLASYTLVNLGGDARLGERLSVYARVENALDEDYEDVHTFRTPGRAAFVGLRAGF
jgi:vitamin B12 transporter